MSAEHEIPTPPAAPETAGEGTGEAKAESKVDLDPRPRVDRIRKGAILLAILLGLILLTLVTFQDRAPAPPPEEPEADEPSPYDLGLIDRWTAPPKGSETDELEGALATPLEVPNAARLRGSNAARLTPAPLAVELPEPRRPSRRTEQPAPGNGLAAGLDPDLAGRLGELTRRAELRLSEEPPSSSREPAVHDPRQLPRPATNAVRVRLEEPLTPYVIRQGTAIPAVLTQTVRSDLGGMVRALLTTDVTDAATYGHVLLPRGTVAVGLQPRQPLLGERRLLIVWTRLLLPDGRSFTLEDAPAAGRDGALGVPGKIHGHWRQRFGAAALLSLVGAGVQLSQPQRSGTNGSAPDSGQLAAGALGLELGRLSQEVLRRTVDLPPTVTLPPGTPLSLVVTQDLAFEEPYGPGAATGALTPSPSPNPPSRSPGRGEFPRDRGPEASGWMRAQDALAPI